MLNTKGWIGHVVTTVISIVVSVAIPTWIGTQTPTIFTPGEAIIFGVLIFVALSVGQLLYVGIRALDRDMAVFRVWDAQHDVDRRLQEIRRLMHELDEHRATVGPELFSSFFNRKLHDLEVRLRDAVSKDEVRIDETMLEVTTWLLEASFSGRKTDIFRAVHFTDENAFFVGLHSRRYFGQVLGLQEKGRIREVRRLLVYSTQDDLNEAITQRIVGFHNLTPGYECRGLTRSDFDRVLLDYELQKSVKDFGVYGTNYVYKGQISQSDLIVGSYSRDPEEIRRFTECFDHCWSSARPLTAQGAPSRASVDWLMGIED